MPGIGGTRLRECNSTKLVWLNAPLYLDCPGKLLKILDVTYNPETKGFESVHPIRPDRVMGDLRSVSNISDPHSDVCSQFDAMIRFLDKIAGYRPGENLYGVPYDWRLILDTDYWNSFKNSLRDLVEKQQDYCANIKSVFIAMSMGGLVMTKFLKEQTPEWKERYVCKLITIGTPFGGAPRATLSMWANVEDEVVVDNYFLKELFRHCAGTYMCQPNKNCFKGLKILRNYQIGEDQKTFTIDELEKTFDIDIFGVKECREIYRDTYPEAIRVMDEGPGPEVEVHAIAGSAVDTLLAIDYTDCYPRRVGEKECYLETLGSDDCQSLPLGDGIVPYISASYWCNKTYEDGTPYLKSFKIFYGAQYKHADLMRHVEIIQYVRSLLDISSVEDIIDQC